MKSIERIIYILVILALVYGLFLTSNNKDIEYIQIPGDTVFNEIYRDSLKVDSVYEYNTDSLWLHDTVFSVVDTNKIVEEFLKMNVYNDTMQDDSSMTIISNLSITQNRIYKYNLYTKNNRKSVIIRPNNNMNFGIGGIVGYKIFAPTISYQFKHNQIGLGYDLYNKGVVLSYQYKFKLR